MHLGSASCSISGNLTADLAMDSANLRSWCHRPVVLSQLHQPLEINITGIQSVLIKRPEHSQHAEQSQVSLHGFGVLPSADSTKPRARPKQSPNQHSRQMRELDRITSMFHPSLHSLPGCNRVRCILALIGLAVQQSLPRSMCASTWNSKCRM